MIEWSFVLQAESGITAGTTITKVVKVPNHGSGRLVVIVDNDAAGQHDEIWWNDSGGSGPWTAALFETTTTEDNLDAEHQEATAGTYSTWELHDIFFVSATEGYAVGSEHIILRTYDAGATWSDMNSFHDDGLTVRMSVTGPSGEFAIGETVSNTGGSNATGTVVSWDDAGQYLVITGITPGPFLAGETITGDTSTETATVGTQFDTWMYDAYLIQSVFAIEDAASGVQNIWMGVESSARNEGIWTVLTDGTAGASRVYTWTPATVGVQSTFDVYDVFAFFMFDATTGVCGTDNGIYTTTDGLAWTHDPVTTFTVGAFAYSSEDLQSSAYLYAIDDLGDNVPIRMAVTCAGSAWTLDSTNGFVSHAGASGYVGIYYVDGSYSIFYHEDRIFAMDSSTTMGFWCFGENVNVDPASFQTTYWQDTSEEHMGGDDVTPAPDNAAYHASILYEATAPAGTIVSMCRK